MMLIDVFVFAFLSWYVGCIWVSDYGVQKPWYFIINPYYYARFFNVKIPPMPKLDSFFRSSDTATQVMRDMADAFNHVVRKGPAAVAAPTVSNLEAVPESMAIQRYMGTCVDIHN